MKSAPAKDKWTAMLMSLVVPGSGQLYAGSRSCLFWYLSAGSLIALFSVIDLEEVSLWIVFARIFVFGVFSLICAEHAKRCLEPQPRRLQVDPSKANISCHVRQSNQVQLDIELTIHRPCEEVWKDISNIKEFVQVDPFHVLLNPNESQIQQGTTFNLVHQAFGIEFLRVGKILKWQEGIGYAFSDLSPAGVKGLFPHVFFVSVSPLEKKLTSLKVQVRGMWIRTYAPRFFIHLWLRYVCKEHARLLVKVY